MLLNYHICRLVLSSLCVGDLVRLVLSGSRFAGFSPQNKTTDVVIHQRGRKLLIMDILMSETCWAHKKWNKIASDIKLVFNSSTIKITVLVVFVCVMFTYTSACKYIVQKTRNTAVFLGDKPMSFGTCRRRQKSS